MSPPQAGFIGLGALGTPIALQLLKHLSSTSQPLLVLWNRSPEKYDPIKAEYPAATFAASPDELAGKCDVVFTCLANDKAAEDVYGKLLGSSGGAEGKVFADFSTLGPLTSTKLEQQAKAKGATYLACPVFGQPPAVKAGNMVCTMAGDAKGREAVKPYLDGIGRKTIDIGDDVKKGAAVKLLGNATILGSIQLLSEVYGLADAIDFDSSLLNTVCETLFPAPIILNYSNKISKATYDGFNGFTIPNGLKDANLILSLGKDLTGTKVPVPTIARAADNMEHAATIGGEEMDWSSLAIMARVDAGLSPFKEGSDNGRPTHK